MCISAWRLIFGICVHWSLPPSAWTYFLRVNFSLSLALGVNGQKCWAWTIGWGSNLWSSLLDKTLWNWAKNKNTLGTNHMDRISPRMQSWQSWRWILKTFVVVLVVVETQPHRTDLWMSIFAPPDLFTSSPSTIFFSIFWVIGLGNHTYTIPKKRKKQHLQQHISAPNTPPKKTQNQQRTYLPTKTKQPVSGKIPFFFRIRFADVEPNRLVCLDEQRMVFSLLKDAVEFIDDHRHIKGGKPRTVRTFPSYTSRGVP